MDDIMGIEAYHRQALHDQPWVSAPICMRSFTAPCQSTISTLSSGGGF